MEKWWIYLIAAAVGYLLGNMETSILISRVKYKDDIRKHGSGNAGTTNMLRVFGMGPGAVTFIGDFIKGILAVLLGNWIGGEIGGYFAGLFAVLGHNFPVFFGFHGGKGVATSLAVAWMTFLLGGAIATLVLFAVVFATQMVSLGSMLGYTVFMIVSLIMRGDNLPFAILCIILWLMMLLRHNKNIVRIIKGTESKLFKRKKE